MLRGAAVNVVLEFLSKTSPIGVKYDPWGNTIRPDLSWGTGYEHMGTCVSSEGKRNSRAKSTAGRVGNVLKGAGKISGVVSNYKDLQDMYRNCVAGCGEYFSNGGD
jgi:hypothetical protein